MSYKYPRTPHLPNSPGGTSDDKRLASVDHLLFRPLIISEKLDGGNLCFTRTEVFARSHSSQAHGKMYAWAKSKHAANKDLISPGLSIFMEYCNWIHTIEYDVLPSYLFVIGVRDDETGTWLPWDHTEIWACELNLPTVPVIARNISFSRERDLSDFSDAAGKEGSMHGPVREGVAVRLSGSFSDLHSGVAKWVRKDFVPHDAEHWMVTALRPQKLIKP